MQIFYIEPDRWLLGHLQCKNSSLHCKDSSGCAFKICQPYYVYYVTSVYRLLCKATSKLSGVNNRDHLFCSRICNLGRVWQRQLTSAPRGVNWGTSTGTQESIFSRLTHMVGKLLLALVLLHVGLSTGWLGLPHSMVAGSQQWAPKRERKLPVT